MSRLTESTTLKSVTIYLVTFYHVRFCNCLVLCLYFSISLRSKWDLFQTLKEHYLMHKSIRNSRGVRLVYLISKSFDFIEITLISGNFIDFIEISLIVKSCKCLHTTSANSDIFATCTCHVRLHKCSRRTCEANSVKPHFGLH